MTDFYDGTVLARPGGPRIITTTPRADAAIQLLGSGASKENVVLSRDEFSHVQRLYGYRQEPRPQRTDGDKRRFDTVRFAQAGADRNAMRHAECDGVRLLAWLARYVEPGSDPLKTLVQMAIDAGFDVDPEDVEWATGKENENGED